MTAKTVTHTPGDVNHKFMGAAGYDFCATCGSSLRGKRTAVETKLLEALEAIMGSAHDGREIPEWLEERLQSAEAAIRSAGVTQ